MIRCGWCSHVTDSERCGYCGRDPILPYVQRAEEPPSVEEQKPGRPGLEHDEIRRRFAEARAILGGEATVEEIAEQLGVSPRTVRRWKEAIDGH